MKRLPAIQIVIPLIAGCLVLVACERVSVPVFNPDGMEAQVKEKLQRLKLRVEHDPDSAREWGRYARALHAHNQTQPALATYAYLQEISPVDYRWPYLAARLEQKRDAEGASALFQKAIHLKPREAAVYIFAGDNLMQLGRLDDAGTIYRHALDIDPGSVHARFGRAQIAFIEGNLDRARAILEDILARAPHHHESHVLLAQIYQQQGESDKAAGEETLAKIYWITTRPDDPVMDLVNAEAVDSQSHAIRGQRFANRGDHQKAEQEFRRVLEYREGTAQDYANLGASLARQGKLDEAIELYHTGLELEPDHLDCLNNLATALVRMDEYEKAVGYLNRVIEIDPQYSRAYNNLGLIHARQGRADAAIDMYRTAIDLDPGYGEARNNLGLVYAGLDRVQEAEHEWGRALQINPRNQPARFRLSRSLANRSQHRMAIGLLLEGVEQDPGSIRFGRALAWELATAPQDELRNGAKALELAEAIYRDTSNDAESADVLAAALAEVGRYQDAMSASTKALQLVDAQADPAMARAILLHQDAYRQLRPYRQR